MEAISRLVTESLVRHGLDRPVDPRRLQWSRWFRCDSPRSLLVVPSKPGIFAIAEEIMELPGAADALVRSELVGTAAQACPERPREGRGGVERGCPAERSSAGCVEEQRFSAASSDPQGTSALAADGAVSTNGKRMLAVLQFSEDDDMAFTLDRVFTRENPMRARLASGRCFLRFVVIEDQAQRRSICSALNQWILSSVEKASGLPADFASSLELAPVERAGVGRTLLSANTEIATKPAAIHPLAATAAHLDSGSAANLHCPHPLPSGF